MSKFFLFKYLIFINEYRFIITAAKKDIWLEGIPKSLLQEFSGLGSSTYYFIYLEAINPIIGPRPNIWKCLERKRNSSIYARVHMWKTNSPAMQTISKLMKNQLTILYWSGSDHNS